jgi:hypothetical protein
MNSWRSIPFHPFSNQGEAFGECQRAACPMFFGAVAVRERGGIVTSSALRASSPKGEDSSPGGLCEKRLLTDINGKCKEPPL